jgi:hypothetical protein
MDTARTLSSGYRATAAECLESSHSQIREQAGLREKRLAEFKGFTDIEFNPERSLNCQARSCATFIALENSSSLDRAVGSFAGFRELMAINLNLVPLAPGKFGAQTLKSDGGTEL